MTEDLLMNTIKAKRHVNECYERLSDAVGEFDEKWEEKGVNITSGVDWKTKTTLWINVNDRIPGEIHDIIVDFQETFNVELTEVIEEKNLQTSTRKFAYTHWRYVFQHVDRWNL